MSVNGIEIKVGQKWRTRDGEVVRIDGSDDHPKWPWNLSKGRCCTDDGFIFSSDTPIAKDLIELIEDSPPLPAPAADDGWINWGGDACPVPAGTSVEWRLRSGKTGACFATSLSWKVMGNDNDIVAYRVIEAAPKAEQPDADTLASETLQALGWHFDGQAWVQDAPPTPTSALDVQEGGNHYKLLGIQPVEYIEKNQLDYFQGNVVKYITRHKAKNGAEDVKKAAHYCQLILELQYGKEGV